MAKANILIVEDKFIVAEDIATSLRKLGYEVAGVVSVGEEVIGKVRELQPDLVLMDIRLKGKLDGIEVAQLLQDEFGLPVIYLTAHSDSETLERAGRTEPYGYILKPFEERQLYSVIELALNRRRELRERLQQKKGGESPKTSTSSATEDGSSQKGFPNIIGSHEKMCSLLEMVELVAKTDVTVHIYGENGTGKELIADAVHKRSARAAKPFIKLNCSAIPSTLLESALFGHSKGAFTGANKDQEGFIERANGGTLFLDEIGDVSAEIQVKLLRVLQSREYHRVGETSPRKADIRIVTATNQDLKSLTHQGKIREDFYYRINVFPLTVPPLRERGDDIIELAEHFRDFLNPVFSKNVQGFTEEAKQALLSYSWPGNVRELENVMKRAFVLVSGDVIESCHLPQDIVKSGRQSFYTQEIKSITADVSQDTLHERKTLLDALEKAGGNKGKAAEMLGISRVTLWKKLTKLGIATQFGHQDETEALTPN